MSRKHAKHSSHRHRRSTTYSVHSTPPLSMQELEARWNSLRLPSRTRDHLEHILQKEGLGLAFAATTALGLEMQREEQKVTRSFWSWMIEELRLLFLEEGCQHIIETGRLVIATSLTWTLMQGPFLLKYLALLLIVLGIFFIFCRLLSVHSRHLLKHT